MIRLHTGAVNDLCWIAISLPLMPLILVRKGYSRGPAGRMGLRPLVWNAAILDGLNAIIRGCARRGDGAAVVIGWVLRIDALSFEGVEDFGAACLVNARQAVVCRRSCRDSEGRSTNAIIVDATETVLLQCL